MIIENKRINLKEQARNLFKVRVILESQWACGLVIVVTQLEAMTAPLHSQDFKLPGNYLF